MTPTDSAYIAVLENKLQQSERNLYEFRQIFQHWQKMDNRDVAKEVGGGHRVRPKILEAAHDGLYPGQLPNQTAEDEEPELDPAEAGKSEAECIE